LKAHKFLLISIIACFVLSLILTLASYNVSYEEPNIVDAAFVYRGWPLYWTIESWSYWSPPPYPHRISFQPVNFLLDTVFYTIMFQMPFQLYLYSKETRRRQSPSM